MDTYSPESMASTLIVTEPPEIPVTETHRPETSFQYRQRSSSRNSGNSRGCFYRTKPCRFFHIAGFCIKGDRCNFIHEYDAPSIEPSMRNVVEPPADASDNQVKTNETAKIQSERSSPQVSPSLDLENKGNCNYYPITWRVIGGGVLMSGPPGEICEAFMAGHCSDGPDCRFSHPSAAEEDPVEVSTSPVDPYYGFLEIWSPTSPLYLNPLIPALHTPPSPILQSIKPLRRRRRMAKYLNINPLVPYLDNQRHHAPNILLDGHTLLPREPLREKYDQVSSLTSSTPSRSPSPVLAQPLEPNTETLNVPTIARPVSTPPATTSSFMKVVRLFAAEMP
ncbi:hypothetical protein EW026_g1773 [Hermanssonia centrifuga]|uniref:C3H1-type domain-containing protein n=1 Tax=Hermanssonia centrifuga TaxID=98765 RepID=A0A4V3XB65_9APHY|nr:hypothetical protein EW026_g1773 [Hermanssonia centrifuga]